MKNLGLYINGAFQDLKSNVMLHIISIVSIALSLLVIGSFGLFFNNINHVVDNWKKGIKIIAYFHRNVAEQRILDVKTQVLLQKGVQDVTYVTKEEALDYLKQRMQRQKGLFENLNQNPLPASLEINIKTSIKNWEEIEKLAIRVENIPEISDVEYGKGWLDRITAFIGLIKLTCSSIGVLLLVTTFFVISNTIRLIFYSRREEIEIMRLVGATTWFIKAPFFIEGIIHGFFGGIIGLGILYALFTLLFSQFLPLWSLNIFQPHFFSMVQCSYILISCMIIGWLSCIVALRQFLKV